MKNYEKPINTHEKPMGGAFPVDPRGVSARRASRRVGFKDLAHPGARPSPNVDRCQLRDMARLPYGPHLAMDDMFTPSIKKSIFYNFRI